MKIKKLELAGFKSFVDRTVVHFDHPVLGIVGPNGCGKSNIVDAIRWCMGEQSAKHLRGRSMDDVIFSGSDSRAGSELAEVTLTFENDSDDVPIEYKGYAEIAVTRRLHRNGDSDYLINKTPVRLKDVTDLFLGTGVGTKAYSIVEQGKIGLIVSAKPEDRRMLIEEAAGITKYKSKKKQAEKKMELTQQNLLRVGDIVAEIERNLGSLKRQAAKAGRYIAYRKELEDLQLHESSHKFLELTGWIKLESGEVGRLAEEAEHARTALVAREAELETLRLSALAAEETLEKATSENFAAENDVRAEEGAIARGTDKLAALGTRQAQAALESEEIEAQHRALAREREAVSEDVERLGEADRERTREVDEESARVSELVSEQQKADQKVAELRADSSRRKAQIAGGEAQLSGFERRQNEMYNRLEKHRYEKEELEGARLEDEARAKELAIAAEDLRTGKVASADEKVNAEKRLASLRQEIVGSEKRLDEAKSELSKKRSRLHALLEMQSKLEGVGAGVKALLGTRDQTICGLVADRIEAPARFTAALAGLLGSRLQDVVVRDLERGISLLEAMATGKKGRATVVPLHPRYVAGVHTRLPETAGVIARLSDVLRFAEEDEPLVQALVGEAIVCEDAEAARALRETVRHAPIVTLTGTVYHPDGRVAGGTGEDLVAHMLESKREARALSEEVVRLDATATERLKEHQALRAAIAETQGILDRARMKAHQDELALVTAERDQRAMDARVESTRKRLDVLLRETEELAGAMEDAASEKYEAEAKLEEARGALASLEGSFAEAEAAAAAWRAEVDRGRQLLTEKKVHLAGAREKLTAAKGTLLRLERSTAELKTRKERLDREREESGTAAESLRASVAEHREKLDLALGVARAAAEVLVAARSAYETLRAELGEREALLKDLRSAASERKDELTVHEMNLRERQLAMAHLLAGVAEKFRGLDLRRVVGDYHLRPPPDEEVRSRIGELGSLIERMGSVNLDAMREHEEAEKRFAYNTSQKEDLEKALADLERAIQQMNRESKRLFEETFHAVNERFQEIFPRMFRGGRASLRLTNPEDMLETGIDILAQPPGKKLASIELMSGGEKALTAVSLIFAIFQIKPSPFCILDEVDAPLDEANVARYNELIRSMTDRSQFILITHIKRTMQLVDVLYGVTMQEMGVSRLVSVKINDVEQVAKRPGLAAGGGAQNGATAHVA